MQAIADCKDDDMRAILIIIHSGFSRLTAKVDSILGNEEVLKKIVLNGHTEVHNEDHVLIATLRSKNILALCVHVEEQMAKEAAGAGSRRRVSENVVSHVMTAALSILATLLTMGILKALGL